VRFPDPVLVKSRLPETGEEMVRLRLAVTSKELAAPVNATLERVPFPPSVAELTEIGVTELDSK
jgi:hypothetical protein